MSDGRKRMSRSLATLCIAALGGSMMVATPSFAEPDIDDVQAKVETLYHEAEQASERYNDARVEMKQAERRLSALRSDLDRQQGKVDGVRRQVAAAVLTDYQGQALSSTTQLLLSEDPDAFLEQLTTVSEYNDQQSQLMADFDVQARQLEMREAAAKRELARIEDTRQRLAREKAEIDDKAGEAQELLDTLEERAADRAAAQRASRSRDRAAVQNASTEDTSVGVPTSGRASAAVSYAMAQVGDAYVYGAAGPSAFDCSGLTMMAWQQAGVSLPHSSSAQMGSGASVSQSQLQPGDLVFYYSPVSHVGMYIGDGMIAHAANPGSGVTTAPVNSMPYSGAVRPG